jgi:hypothetical protein
MIWFLGSKTEGLFVWKQNNSGTTFYGLNWKLRLQNGVNMEIGLMFGYVIGGMNFTLFQTGPIYSVKDFHEQN